MKDEEVKDDKEERRDRYRHKKENHRRLHRDNDLRQPRRTPYVRHRSDWTDEEEEDYE